MNVTYIGPVLDSSGYGNASRNNVAALHEVGVKVDVVPISFEKAKTDMGKLGKLMQSLTNPHADNDIRIIHCTPQNYPQVINKTEYNIGYAAWESDRLPDGWSKYINMLQEIWVPSEYNVEVFKNSGVNIPVKCMPHAFDVTKVTQPDLSLVSKRNDDEFIFYSIFQWLERKNPVDLLNAYLTEFGAEENVTLVLKTFMVNHNSPKEVAQIKQQIGTIKRNLHLKTFPRVLLITELLSSAEMAGLHAVGDCFVLAHRCEGFGIPIAEAMLSGKPTISTGYGGAVDFVSHGETGYLSKYMVTPVVGMPWPIYNAKQNWAQPDITDFRKLMRHVYENRDEAKQVGQTGKEWIEQNLSWQSVGNMMKERLLEIEKGL